MNHIPIENECYKRKPSTVDVGELWVNNGNWASSLGGCVDWLGCGQVRTRVRLTRRDDADEVAREQR